MEGTIREKESQVADMEKQLADSQVLIQELTKRSDDIQSQLREKVGQIEEHERVLADR